MGIKRARSEDDENCGGQSLLKTHVSEREVNLGVLQERRMQDVYNKTMEMLFRGTKNLANNNAVMEVERSGDDGEGVSGMCVVMATTNDRRDVEHLLSGDDHSGDVGVVVLLLLGC